MTFRVKALNVNIIKFYLLVTIDSLIVKKLDIDRAQASGSGFEKVKPKLWALISHHHGLGLARLSRAGLGRLRASSPSWHITTHVFWLDSGGIRSIPGIPQNRILAGSTAKIVISIPQNSDRIQNGHGITGMELMEGMDWNGIRRIFFNGNSNYLLVITIN